jgi:hypothetical protein
VSSELQFRVLGCLESNPHLTQRELTRSYGVSLGGVKLLSDTLLAKDFQDIEVQEQQK